MDGAGAGQAMAGATLAVAMAGAIQAGAGAIQVGAGVRDGVSILLIIHHIMEITLQEAVRLTTVRPTGDTIQDRTTDQRRDLAPTGARDRPQE